MNESPVHRVINIPGLVSHICHHLGPWHFINAIQVCKVFYVAILPYRWRVLDTAVSKQGQAAFVRFPSRPSPEVTAALLQYGARFAREVTLHENSVGSTTSFYETKQSLRILKIGSMSLHFIIEVFAYLPEQVEDLSLEVDWHYSREDASDGGSSEHDDYSEDGGHSDDSGDS
ncbi:hypothetical protein BGW39_002230 [Mortierella sp. 14UC]|nr:hypothetical protein BGW39_002230 [Mortierella sp. 14UC]